VTQNQASVYDVLRDYGPMPDHALVPLVQHAAQAHQSSSGIRTRRCELETAGLVRAVGNVRTGSGRLATIWEAV
jgi:hypothetical protein